MASPPYNHQYGGSALSPPYPSNTQLQPPLKRRHTDMPSSAPSIKRRKASILSTTSAASSHPLRQTSFPPENIPSQTPLYSRSPSMDTMSLVSGSAAGGSKKKRPRKSKGAANDNSSTLGGKAKSAVSGTSGKNKRRASREVSGDEEDEGGEEMAVEIVARTQEERQKEIEHRAMLVRAFDEDQFSRYEAWRSSRLSDAVVRRIVNQTLSQSAPASVILAVKSVAKIFAGEVIEGARKVQSQWLETSEESQTGIPSPPADSENTTEKDTKRGPLMPDHLRESIRRYKTAGEGCLAGQLGLWQLQQHSGVERFGVKVRGKRLLK